MHPADRIDRIVRINMIAMRIRAGMMMRVIMMVGGAMISTSMMVGCAGFTGIPA
jgi:hypothetical protein